MTSHKAIGITGFGCYIPRRRLQRQSIVESNSWFDPNLKALGKGERSIANWDEDSLTMGLEASRRCLGDAASLESLYFASTTAPYSERLNAGILVKALNLPSEQRAIDITSCQRSGTSALIDAMKALPEGSAKNSMVIASDKRRARCASVQELRFGDGAAAIRVGYDNPLARFLGSASSTVDFTDHFRGEHDKFDYYWEDRWVRDEGYMKLVAPVLSKALQESQISAEDITHFVLPCPYPRIADKIAKKVGLSASKVVDNLAGQVGDTGTPHGFLMLGDALEQAQPGDKILMGVLSSGVDALVFEVTDHIHQMPKDGGLRSALAHGQKDTNYMRWLAFNDMITLEKGMRAEKDHRTALTVNYRNQDLILGLVGGRCTHCGTAQFPKARICVNPECGKMDSQGDYSFASRSAEILSWSADHLTYTPDPPHHYGMITFKDGGRFMAEFTDVDPGTIDAGTAMNMVFRIKAKDEQRGFTRYFWKATPTQP